MKLPVDQSPAVAFTAFADLRLGLFETEIGTALCTICAGRTLIVSDYDIKWYFIVLIMMY